MRGKRSRRVYVFRAKLVGLTSVKRRVAVRSDQTLGDLHTAIQDAFGWDSEHLYAFWLDGQFWSLEAVEYSHPEHAYAQNPNGTLWDMPETKSADTDALDTLDLIPGQKIAYSFDFGDEWRVELTVADIAADDGGRYPALLESIGKAPPQYIDDLPLPDRKEDAA